MYKKLIKRLLDIIFSIVGIIILAPCLVVISIMVRIGMGSPIVFFQDRVGVNEEVFKFYKFRSMTNEKDEKGNLLDESQRLTKFGKFIRSTSVDELPEIFLILSGKMSFIGPRPLPTYYLPYYKENERERHSVRGGLIPADTLSGNTTPSWDEQLEYDVYYAENCSFLLDVKVLLQTIKVLYLRAVNDYGAAERPHLSEERAFMMMNKETK